MIWDATDSSFGKRRSTIVSYIADEIREVCGDSVLSNGENVENLARAVESFIDTDEGRSVVSSKYLVMLAARALSSVGEGEAARKLMLVGTGLVKPARWEVVNGKSMWVLDLKQITVRDDVFLEMVFFNSLNIILDTIADIWDEPKGHGVLGLRNVCGVADHLARDKRKGRKSCTFGREVLKMCEERLSQIATNRKWEAVPVVMDLTI